MCGSKLEFQILPFGTKGVKTVIEIIAENVDVLGYDSGNSQFKKVKETFSVYLSVLTGSI